MRARVRPIAINLWSQARRVQAYVSSLQAMTIPSMLKLEGGLLCPFLMDFGLTANQRVRVWRSVWDARTLVRTARQCPGSKENLVRAIYAPESPTA